MMNFLTLCKIEYFDCLSFQSFLHVKSLQFDAGENVFDWLFEELISMPYATC